MEQAYIVFLNLIIALKVIKMMVESLKNVFLISKIVIIDLRMMEQESFVSQIFHFVMKGIKMMEEDFSNVSNKGLPAIKVIKIMDCKLFAFIAAKIVTPDSKTAVHVRNAYL